MIKVTVLHPHADVEYNRKHHVALTAALPGLRRYVVSEIMVDPLTGLEPPYNLINEIWFDDLESYERAFQSPEVERAIADVANFSDHSKVVTLVCTENEIPM